MMMLVVQSVAVVADVGDGEIVLLLLLASGGNETGGERMFDLERGARGPMYAGEEALFKDRRD